MTITTLRVPVWMTASVGTVSALRAAGHQHDLDEHARAEYQSRIGSVIRALTVRVCAFRSG